MADRVMQDPDFKTWIKDDFVIFEGNQTGLELSFSNLIRIRTPDMISIFYLSNALTKYSNRILPDSDLVYSDLDADQNSSSPDLDNICTRKKPSPYNI